MTHVASDPVISRPMRPETALVRTGAGPDKSGAFEGILDSAQETPRRARAERPAQTRASDRSDKPKATDRSEPRNNAREPANDVPAADKPVSNKPATAPDTRQAKNGQPSDPSQQATDPAETTASVMVVVAPDPAAAAEVTVAAASEVAPIVPEAETETAAPAGQTAETTADAEMTVTADAPTIDPATVIAAAVTPPTPAPATTPDAKPSIDPAAIAAVDLEAATAPVPGAPAKAPTVGDAEAAGTKPQTKTDAETGTAPAAVETAEEPLAARAAVTAEPSEKTEKKESAAPPSKAEPASAKPEHAAHSEGVRQATTDASKTPIEAKHDEPKSPAPHQPRTAAEHVASRPAAAEARAEISATAAPSAQINIGGPIIPPHLAMQASPLAAMSPLAALRVDTAAEAAIPVAGIAVEIVARANEGSKRFEIRLDPPELGRIDVRLDVDTAGKVTSRLVVERTETLDLLRRDAHQLERALQHAGLNTEGGLEFSLRDQNFANREQTPREAPTTRLIVPDDETAVSEAARRGYGRMIGLGGGVDIRV